MLLFFCLIIFLLSILLTIAFLTVWERKVMASIQRRVGPNKVLFGYLQAIADGLKLIKKQLVLLKYSDLFIIPIPFFIFAFSLCQWFFVPFNSAGAICETQFNILLFLVISSFEVLYLLALTWTSNNQYVILSSVRLLTQVLSFELVLTLVFLPFVAFTGSFNFTEIVFSQNYLWNIFFPPSLFLIMIIVILAETNRTPFDIPEAESELVSGYNLEYSSFYFALLFLAEYANILIMSHVTTCLFLGGWNFFNFYNFLNLDLQILVESLIFSAKSLSITFLFILIRAAFPRYRFDKWMDICWTKILPLTFVYIFILIFYFGLCLTFINF